MNLFTKLSSGSWLNIVFLGLVICPSVVHGHSGSVAYIHIDEESPSKDGELTYKAHLQFNLVDLHEIIWLDSDNNGEITWAEVKNRKVELLNFSKSVLVMKSGDAVCSNKITGEVAIAEIGGLHFTDVALQYFCPGDQEPEVIYEGLLKFNARHRAILSTKNAKGEVLSHIFTNADRTYQLSPIVSPISFKTFNEFVGEGLFHVYTGYDHVLFLILLLLPSVVMRKDKKWVPEPSLRHCCIEVLKIVTAFTVAHSLTMALAVFEIVNISPSIIEPVIAASIAIAAINNLWPYARTTWVIAGLFGLVHGFGFASLLDDAGIGNNNSWFILSAFNIGIELAQASLVLVIMPVLWRFRHSKQYATAVITFGSLCASILAVFLTFTRVF